MIDKRTSKYQINIKPKAPKLTALIKMHKESEPIWLVVNSKQAPPYKIAKYLIKRINNLVNLPYTFATKNSCEIAQELNNIQLKKHSRMITLDVKDLCQLTNTKHPSHH